MRSPGTLEGDDYSAWDDDSPPEQEVPEALAPIDLVVDGGVRGVRLDKWLAQALPRYSRAAIQRWIESGTVLVNGRSASVRQALYDDDRVHVVPQASAAESAFQPEAGPLDIIEADASLIVINKPAGLVVHPAAGNWSGTLLNRLLHFDPALARVARAGIVHRLDKDTSGLMVVARTQAAQTDLVRQLAARSVHREYLAVVHGSAPPQGTIDRPIGRDPRERTRMAVLSAEASGARAARTHFETLAHSASRSLVLCRLETGRTHQIRVHLQSIGHSLVGDPVYRGRTPRDTFARQALHAWRLEFADPDSGAERAFRALPPADLIELIMQSGFADAWQAYQRAHEQTHDQAQEARHG